MIHDRLIACVLPPLRGVVEFPSRIHDPERHRLTRDFLHLRNPSPLLRREVDVTLEIGRHDFHPELFREELRKAVDEMPRAAVAAVDERVAALDALGIRIVVAQRREVGLCSQSAGQLVRTSVVNFPGWLRCKSRKAAVSITMSPGDCRLMRIIFLKVGAFRIPARPAFGKKRTACCRTGIHLRIRWASFSWARRNRATA